MSEEVGHGVGMLFIIMCMAILLFVSQRMKNDNADMSQMPIETKIGGNE